MTFVTLSVLFFIVYLLSLFAFSTGFTVIVFVRFRR